MSKTYANHSREKCSRLYPAHYFKAGPGFKVGAASLPCAAGRAGHSVRLWFESAGASISLAADPVNRRSPGQKVG